MTESRNCRCCCLAIGLLALSSLGAGGGVLELPPAFNSMVSNFYEQTVVADGPVIYWRLSEASTANPAVNLGTLGVAGDGTYGAATTLGNPSALFNPGSDTSAGFLTGSTTRFVRRPAFAFPSGNFSVEFWVNSPAAHNNTGLVSYNAPGQENGFLLFNNPGSTLDLNINTVGMNSGLDPTTGAWQHVVVTYNRAAGQARVYNNGVQVGGILNYTPGSGPLTGGDLILAQEQDGMGASGTYTLDPAQAFTGLLDEFALYPYALTLAQIQQHYGIGIGSILPPVPPLAPEPSSWALLGAALLGLGGTHLWRRRRAAA